jgi:hypothetical protein
MFFQIHLNQISTPTLKLILRVATLAGKKEKNVGAKKNRLGVYFFVRLCNGISIFIARNQYDSVPNASDVNATRLD